MAFRDWFIRDLGWKLFSLVLAVAIWLTVNRNLGETGGAAEPAIGDKQTTYDDLPILVVSSASDVRDFRVLPNTVTVTVSGATSIMAELKAKEIRAVVDLTSIEPAKKLRLPVDVSVPPGVKLVSKTPSSVEVVFPTPPEQKP